ncbi:MAG: hypothetical protein HQK81_12375 [Desulfovibrionaceae bacterium]|nr:hypothetical protein [Desulfovibrionaceae bacterium]MBF0514839.1 hypothetical protein [Desulfovibrionaceae bacterium]
MKRRIVALIVTALLAASLAGCAGTSAKSALATFGSASEAATQLQGATSAIVQLVGATPTMAILDPSTAQAVANYMGWANFGLQALGVAAKAASAL